MGAGNLVPWVNLYFGTPGPCRRPPITSLPPSHHLWASLPPHSAGGRGAKRGLWVGASWGERVPGMACVREGVLGTAGGWGKLGRWWVGQAGKLLGMARCWVELGG